MSVVFLGTIKEEKIKQTCLSRKGFLGEVMSYLKDVQKLYSQTQIHGQKYNLWIAVEKYEDVGWMDPLFKQQERVLIKNSEL